MNVTTPSTRSGVAPSMRAICGAKMKMSTEMAKMRYVDSQKPCENALRAPAASPAPRRLPATVATPMPSEPPNARFSSSSGMMMPTTARPNDPRPLPMITPSRITMTACAAMPMSVMSEYFTNRPCTGFVPSSRSSSLAATATVSDSVAISAALLSRCVRGGVSRPPAGAASVALLRAPLRSPSLMRPYAPDAGEGSLEGVGLVPCGIRRG